MTNIKKNFLSIVALGKPNPQILNVNFLVSEEVIPKEEEPFKSLLARREKPFTKYISTPVFTNLQFDNIEFLVNESRIQIREVDVADWSKSRIGPIMQKYLKVLPYTPVQVIGFNFNLSFELATPEDAVKFREVVLPNSSRLLDITPRDQLTADVVVRYPRPDSNDRVSITVKQDAANMTNVVANFNYEFDFVDSKMDTVLLKEKVRQIPELSAYSESIFQKLLEL